MANAGEEKLDEQDAARIAACDEVSMTFDRWLLYRETIIIGYQHGLSRPHDPTCPPIRFSLILHGCKRPKH
jgi:hypothetical protein